MTSGKADFYIRKNEYRILDILSFSVYLDDSSTAIFPLLFFGKIHPDAFPRLSPAGIRG